MVGSGPDKPANPPSTPPQKPTTPSAQGPPHVTRGRVRHNMNTEKPSSRMATAMRNADALTCRSNIVPNGTPARPGTMNGNTRARCTERQMVGKVEICDTTEQTSTSDAATLGCTTKSQMPSATSPVPKPARPDTKP